VDDNKPPFPKFSRRGGIKYFFPPAYKETIFESARNFCAAVCLLANFAWAAGSAREDGWSSRQLEANGSPRGGVDHRDLLSKAEGAWTNFAV
jgi:hypothetical protein